MKNVLSPIKHKDNRPEIPDVQQFHQRYESSLQGQQDEDQIWLRDRGRYGSFHS